MIARPLHILAPTRYPWTFNGPRVSRHNIVRRPFLPFNKISKSIEGITIFQPFPLKRYDLIHAFNRIPIGRTPYVIGFESHLPRGFGVEHTWFFRAMSKSLASDRCRAIIAISEYARRQCLAQHQAFPWVDQIRKKLVVRYPNIQIPSETSILDHSQSPWRLVFVGNHFARKGGLVALRIAELAHLRAIPIHVELISSLEVGAASWTDPLVPDYFEPYRKLIVTLPNVTHYGRLPNAEVIEHVSRAHFTLLPTFSDSFGFSAIESMAQCTPVIATAQCALPEFIRDSENGILLPLPLDAQGEWADAGRGGRESHQYAQLYDEQVRALTEQACSRILHYMQHPQEYTPLRSRAKKTALQLFNHIDAAHFWDALYERSA